MKQPFVVERQIDKLYIILLLHEEQISVPHGHIPKVDEYLNTIINDLKQCIVTTYRTSENQPYITNKMHEIYLIRDILKKRNIKPNQPEVAYKRVNVLIKLLNERIDAGL